jgi:hypothetical protein
MKTLLLALLLSTLSMAQSYIFSHSIGRFSSPLSFHINSAGFIYVSDGQSDEIYKYDTLGILLRQNGGYGWDNAVFDQPIDIFSTTLNVLVTDYNNHRIQLFDKDLNFISLFSTRNSSNIDARFGYPISSALSPQGDLFILDSENNRIIKFDLFGNFIQNFGGYDWGAYSLTKPRKLSVSSSNNVYVLDQDAIFIYNQFGTGIGTIPLPEGVLNLNINSSHLTLNSADMVYLIDLRASDFSVSNLLINGYDQKLNIISSIIFNSRLYLLTSKNILVFNRE